MELLNPQLRSMVQKRFGQELKPMEVLPAYATVLFNFLRIDCRSYYENRLPQDCLIILEHLEKWFEYVSRYGKLDDYDVFNDIMILELAKTFADDRLSPGNRIQIIYACGNLPYMVQVLEGFANHPFQSANK